MTTRSGKMVFWTAFTLLVVTIVIVVSEMTGNLLASIGIIGSGIVFMTGMGFSLILEQNEEK